MNAIYLSAGLLAERIEWVNSDLDEEGTGMGANIVTGINTLSAILSEACGLDAGIKTCSLIAFVLGKIERAIILRRVH